MSDTVAAHYFLSDETMITLRGNGTATLEVVYDEDVVAIQLTAEEVDRLRVLLNRGMPDVG